MKVSTVHSIPCQAPQALVFEIIRDSSRWPDLFEPCQAVNKLDSSDVFERVEIQAMVGKKAMKWVSHRQFLDEIYGVDTTVMKPIPLLKSMKANWRVIAIDTHHSVIMLTHDYEVNDDVRGIVSGVETAEQAAKYMADAIEENSIKELGNISEIARELDVKTAWSSVHSVVCNSKPNVAFSVLKDIEKWPQIFDICQSAKIIKHQAGSDLIEVSARAGENKIEWLTKRSYDDENFAIYFNLPKPMPNQKAMYGTWRVLSLDNDQCLITAERHFELVDDVLPEAYRAMRDFVEDNASVEMTALRDYIDEIQDWKKVG